MRDGSRARSDGHGRLRRACVSVCLLAWLGFLPLGQTLHVLLADHGHRYCAEHDRIEDVLDEQQQLATRTPDAGPAFGQSNPRAHTACAVLNIDLSRKPFVVSASAISSHPAPAAPGALPTLAPPHTSSDLILLAPKNSPPTLGA